MIIAIDGPAASGKGTIARRLAIHFGLPHLDTGLLYRATARKLIDAGDSLEDVAKAVAAARNLRIGQYSEAELRGAAAGEAASRIAAMPEVRTALVEVQRHFAAKPPGAVLDGRDIGTVICPGAEVKIFVTATPAARARRRALELAARGEAADEADVLADIRRRDARDSGRSASPLKAADDAAVLDTTDLGVEAAFTAALSIVAEKCTKRPRSIPRSP